MNTKGKGLLVSSCTILMFFFFLTGCQQEEPAPSHSGKPQSYEEPIPVILEEEEPIYIQ
ncbi:hypothetical protein [Shouchella patagoniensis]|uniref:hypothetical protein n=1 Tax=Shouchella patagoniensis TaxID=228576 RepID=UPI001473B22E|nr:hypothetical protein [Shouchella patagoniensis]